MTRRRDPICPVPGRPCLLALDDFLVETARVQSSYEQKEPTRCRRCGETNPIVLAGSSLCYRHRVRARERDHVKGSGSGPAVIDGDANANRIAMRAEALAAEIISDDLCTPCRDGYQRRIGQFVARLGVDL